MCREFLIGNVDEKLPNRKGLKKIRLIGMFRLTGNTRFFGPVRESLSFFTSNRKTKYYQFGSNRKSLKNVS